jgi:hypothetical protein
MSHRSGKRRRRSARFLRALEVPLVGIGSCRASAPAPRSAIFSASVFGSLPSSRVLTSSADGAGWPLALERTERRRPSLLKVGIPLNPALQESLDSPLRFGPRQCGLKGVERHRGAGASGRGAGRLRRRASRSPSADGNETWLTRSLAAAIADRSKEAIRRAREDVKLTLPTSVDLFKQASHARLPLQGPIGEEQGARRLST